MSTCPGTGKLCFPTKASARRAGSAYYARHMGRMDAYRCACGSWHIGHRKVRKPRRVRR